MIVASRFYWCLLLLLLLLLSSSLLLFPFLCVLSLEHRKDFYFRFFSEILDIDL